MSTNSIEDAQDIPSGILTSVFVISMYFRI